MAREFLGGFELLVLLALIKLGDEPAYWMSVAQEIEASSGRSYRRSLYLTLKRL